MDIELYEVGGSIRDRILGIENKDRDFVAVCPEGWNGLIAWAEEWLDKVFLITPEYFTIRGIKNKEVFDIVLARVDGAYSDGRHPDKVEPGTLLDDLARRDFTMNAIAQRFDTEARARPPVYDVDHVLIDPHGGILDIKDGWIRCVGYAPHRIKEDALRIVRAIRFEATKPGMRMDRELHQMVVSDKLHVVHEASISTQEALSDLIMSVSTERIREELTKMFRYNTIDALDALWLVDGDLLAAIMRDPIWLKPTMGKR